MWIVELQHGCWLSDGEGDPPRTLQITNAQYYETEQCAIDALEWARTFREFCDASIVRVNADE